ncbi:Lem3/Cdc50 [Tothia fuscella]|uniref:Lem3/Cdc50 n=1 Tax=Tothia fuscella TaxID=1048955 RepID=A0A9P4U0S1_9PEZI|nr:Lem3/Cdc50 [Tothia fuscella]
MSQTEQVQHADSISSQDPNHDDKKKKVKNRRPANTAFRQQRLKAWQPILTPKTVLPLFFAVGVIFAPIGGLLLWASSQVQEISIDYSLCTRDAPLEPRWLDIPSSKISKSFKASGKKANAPQWQQLPPQTVSYPQHDLPNDIEVADTKICRLKFDIESDLKPPVLFYYRLTNFYQNHRRYVKSFDQNQLNGDARTADQIKGGDCDPLTVETAPDGSRKPYYPCGLIANSLFNDTFNSPQWTNPQNQDGGNQTQPYEMSQKGIAWSSDADLYKKTKYDLSEIVPPPNWRRKYPEYNSTIHPPNVHEDEPFQVWMRTAGLPTFSKLALRNDVATMHAGTYTVDIWDEFNVTMYTGSKSILISTRTVMGGKNPFLGIAYIVVGGICILLGALFTATHIIKPRKLGDHTYLTWEQPGSTTATATGSRVRPADAA